MTKKEALKILKKYCKKCNPYINNGICYPCKHEKKALEATKTLLNNK